jgi:hypothetical protein
MDSDLFWPPLEFEILLFLLLCEQKKAFFFITEQYMWGDILVAFGSIFLLCPYLFSTYYSGTERFS